MTPAALTAIDRWASGWAGEGSAEFAAVVELCAAYRIAAAGESALMERIDQLTRMNESLCDKLAICSDTITRLAERCHGQSELLSRRAEGVTG